MDKYIEVIQQSLQLSCTVGEGMEHINGRLNEGHYEEALSLFQDVIQAFISIQQAISPFLNELPPNHLQSLTEPIQNSLDHITTAYEQKNWGLAGDTMQHQVLPAYSKWKEELERCCGLYIAS